MLTRKLLACSIFFLFTFLASLAFNVHSVSAVTSAELINLINQYRSSKGLATLTADQKLKNAACWHASDMAAKGYFSHTDSLGRDPFIRMAAFGVSGGSRAENIASLTNQANSAQKIFDGWKRSSGHNANMLGAAFTRIGIGFAYRSANKTYYWSADFASGTRIAGATECGSTTAPKPPPTPAPTPAPTPKPTPPTTVSQPVTKAKPPTTPTASNQSKPSSTKVLGEEKPSSSSSAQVSWKPYQPPTNSQTGLTLPKTSTWTILLLFFFFVINFLVLGKASLSLIKSTR